MFAKFTLNDRFSPVINIVPTDHPKVRSMDPPLIRHKGNIRRPPSPCPLAGQMKRFVQRSAEDALSIWWNFHESNDRRKFDSRRHLGNGSAVHSFRIERKNGWYAWSWSVEHSIPRVKSAESEIGQVISSAAMRLSAYYFRRSRRALRALLRQDCARAVLLHNSDTSPAVCIPILDMCFHMYLWTRFCVSVMFAE